MNKNGRFICVLDGVGSWTYRFTDVGKMTKEFVQHIADVYDEQEDGLSLVQIIHKAYTRVKSSGSTTVCAAELAETYDERDEVTLRTLNIGDSGYLLLRPQADNSTTVLFKSESQQHFFNCPH